MRFLLDANLSPKTANFLRLHGYDVKSITEDKLGHLSDNEIVSVAYKEKRTVVKFDQDFGEIFHFQENRGIGVIVLRIKNQTVENVNSVLAMVLASHRKKILRNKKTLIIVKDDSLRILS